MSEPPIPRQLGADPEWEPSNALREWMRRVTAAAGTAGGGVATQDEGISVDPAAATLNFVGAGVTATDAGANVTTVTVPGSTYALEVLDEGVSKDAAVVSLDFVGAGVTATNAGHAVTVTIPAAAAAANTIITKEEGVQLSAAVTTLDFVGAGVTASGAGATTTVTIPSDAPVDAQYVTLATNATLTQERVLTGTAADISVTDNGAGSTVVLDLINTAVTPGTYGSAVLTPIITADAKGRSTSITTVTSVPYILKALWRDFTRYACAIFGSATMSNLGCPNSAGNTGYSAATTGLLASLPRVGHITTSAVNQIIFNHGRDGANASPLWMGNATGLGGFRFVYVFGIEAVQTTMTFFCGIYPTATQIGVASIPWSASTNMINCIVVGADPNSTQLSIWHNNDTGAPTVVDTTLDYAIDDLYAFEVQTTGNASSVAWTLTQYRLSGGAVTATEVIGSPLTTNLPVNTTFLNPALEVNNGTSGTPGIAGLCGLMVAYDLWGQ